MKSRSSSIFKIQIGLSISFSPLVFLCNPNTLVYTLLSFPLNNIWTKELTHWTIFDQAKGRGFHKSPQKKALSPCRKYQRWAVSGDVSAETCPRWKLLARTCPCRFRMSLPIVSNVLVHSSHWCYRKGKSYKYITYFSK